MGLATISLLITATLLADYMAHGKVVSALRPGPSNEAIAKKAVDFINKGGQTASIESVSEESGLVKIRLTVDGNPFDSYATKDGKLLFPKAFNLDESAQ